MVVSTPPGVVKVVEAAFLMSCPSVEGMPKKSIPEVAVMGRSNVGKSSLLNYVANHRKLARVSNTPGRTRDLNIFRLTLHSGVETMHLHLIDLPGYGWAEMSKTEKARLSSMLGDYVQSGRPAAACLLLDVRRDPSEEDQKMYEAILRHGVTPIPVITKVDKVVKSKRSPRMADIMGVLGLHQMDAVPTSVEENVGRDELMRRIWTLAAGDGQV